MEKANQTLNFFGAEIELNYVGLTCVWRKPTNTGLLLNFDAICPKLGNPAKINVFYIGLNVFVSIKSLTNMKQKTPGYFSKKRLP